MTTALKKTLIGLQVAVVAFALAALVPALANADTVTIEPSGDTSGTKDGKAFNNALAEGNSIMLVNGATYYTDRNIIVTSNTSITATGATIISVEEESGGFRNRVQSGKYNYDSCVNFTCTGGYWKHVNENGFQHSMIQFTHASNITMQDVTVEGSYEHHAMEFIACKNVKVDGCNLISIGECGKTTAEDALQFDIASPRTAPTVKKNYGASATAGQTCQNITVNNCKIDGSRGITTNYTKDTAYMGKCHKNITITNNTITAKTSEAIALFNAVGKINVKKNTIISNSPRKNTSYSVGLHFALFGKVSKSAAKKAKVTVQSNTIKGGRNALFVCSHSKGVRMGKFTIKSNKAYCKKGKANAIKNAYGSYFKKPSAVKFTLKKNKTYKWK